MDSSTRYRSPGSYVQALGEHKTACDGKKRKSRALELERSKILAEYRSNRTWTTEEFTKHEERLSLVNILFNEQKELLLKLAKIENSIIRSNTDGTSAKERWEDVLPPAIALLRDLQSQRFRR